MKGEKVEIGRIDIPADKKSWMKHVLSDGRVMATPPGGRKYTDEERAAVDESDKKVRALYVKKSKGLREAERKALTAFKKEPLSERLKNAYLAAKAEREAFDKDRKSSEAKAKREARQRVLK